MHSRRIGALIALVVAAACEAPPVSPSPNRAPSFDDLSDANGARIVKGQGVVDLSTAGVGDMQFHFAAVQTPSGKASGFFWQYRERAGKTIEFLGKVTCLAFQPGTGRAWIGGTILTNSSTDEGFRVDTLHMPGMDVWFRFVDYGEGATATQADRSTTLGFKHSANIITSEEYCATRPWPDTPVPDARTFSVLSGNIDVP